MQAMRVDEALEHADEWIKGVTLYEGAQGWRVACATLAAEVRRLRAVATCGCGDHFTEHDPGTCGNCLAGMDRTVEVERLRLRVERLRGMLKTNAGWWYELSDDDKGDACIEAAGDMEAPMGPNA